MQQLTAEDDIEDDIDDVIPEECDGDDMDTTPSHLNSYNSGFNTNRNSVNIQKPKQKVPKALTLKNKPMFNNSKPKLKEPFSREKFRNIRTQRDYYSQLNNSQLQSDRKKSSRYKLLNTQHFKLNETMDAGMPINDISTQ